MCRDGVCGIHLFSIIIDWHPMVKLVFKLKLLYKGLSLNVESA